MQARSNRVAHSSCLQSSQHRFCYSLCPPPSVCSQQGSCTQSTTSTLLQPLSNSEVSQRASEKPCPTDPNEQSGCKQCARRRLLDCLLAYPSTAVAYSSRQPKWRSISAISIPDHLRQLHTL